MRPESSITAKQLRRLQTLWGLHAHHAADADSSRESRLAWISAAIGRSVTSSKDLTSAEAASLIDALQLSLGQPVNDRPRPRRRSFSGTAGRRCDSGQVAAIATADDLTRITEQLSRLGWDQPRLEAFLRSPSSPLKGRTVLRTTADVNRVWYALKRIADRGQRRAS